MEIATTNQQHQIFDYSVINADTVVFLKEKENAIEGIFHKARFEVGKKLKEAQEHLAQNRYGCFQQWAESIGFKKQTTYNLINYHNLIVQNLDSKEMIESLPKSLSMEISKTSTPPELKQAVLNGDITTHKEYQAVLKAQKEAERRAEEAEQKADNMKRMYEDASNMTYETKNRAEKAEQQSNHLKTANEILTNKLKTASDPIIVETPVQVFPPDYERIKQENEQLKNHKPASAEFKQYAQQIENEAEVAEKISDALMNPQLVSLKNIDQAVRCYLEYSPNTISGAIEDCDRSIAILQNLKQAFINTTKLKVVKK